MSDLRYKYLFFTYYNSKENKLIWMKMTLYLKMLQWYNDK